MAASEEFEKHTLAAQEVWDSNKSLTINREKAAMLLEIPKLMETCVRNGNIDEALDLQSFVQRLSVLHGDLRSVQSLAEASVRGKDLILAHLTDKLKSGIQLPECLSVVGYLRRLGVYSERDLRLCFLLCREQWIMSIVAELDATQPFDFLKRLTDIHRLHLFDAVMQYKAIFSSETTEADGGLLSEWALHRVTFYLDALRTTLKNISDGASLLSLLESSMYCGMSLGRVGLDFRIILISIFEPCILDLFKAKLDEALAVFSTHLETHRWVTSPSKDVSTVSSNGSLDTASPPLDLAQHLPLALFVNGFLSGLNELRHCPPLRGRRRIVQWTRTALEQLATKLARHAARPFDAAQRDAFLSACRDFVSLLCPYLAASLSSVYPGSDKELELASIVEPLVKIDGCA